jgi:Putative zinc-finger
MKADHTHDEHAEIADLIPWYVNGTLGLLERQKVDLHLARCPACGDDLSMERRIYEGMAAAPPVEYMPAASLKRLLTHIDGLAEVTPRAEPVAAPRMRQAMPWKGLAAAALVLVVVTAVSQTDRWAFIRAPELQPRYHTVTSSLPRPPDEVIRAVFSPTLTLVDLQVILDESHLKIISGPTEAGVYSLASTSPGSVSELLAALRRNPGVRFAESTRGDPDPSAREPP